MSVSITFEPSGINGLVAEGTYLIDAARRMGAPLGAGCTAGKGECPSCVVSVKAGANLLSPPSLAEEQQLGADQLDQSLRLACQVKIENHGEVVVMAAKHHFEITQHLLRIIGLCAECQAARRQSEWTLTALS